MNNLNMTIGENFPEMISNLIHEVCFQQYDYDKAMKILMESFMGMETNLAHKILTSEAIIVYDNENQIGVQETENPSFNPIKWYLSKIHEYENRIDELYETAEALQSDLIDYDIKIPFKTFVELNKNGVVDLHDFDDQETEEYLHFMDILNDYRSKFDKFHSMYSKLMNINVNYDLVSKIDQIINYMSNSFNFVNHGLTNHDKLSQFLNAQKVIDAIEELTPSTVIHDAGWISPEGVYYGLNGTVGNMLHINIADMLYEQGMIPKPKDQGADSWMEQNGWMKQQNNKLEYAGYIYDIPVTKEQMLAAKNLLSQRYAHAELHEFSVEVSKLLEIDIYQLKKHFEF